MGDSTISQNELVRLTKEGKSDDDSPHVTPTFIVGIGASAGGLESLEMFFDAMPPDTGMAFVVVQHLSPDFKSMMDELLARHTKIAIHRVANEMPVEANAVYLIPPKKEMILSSGKLLLTDKDPTQSLSFPINTFFRSLAQDAGERSVAIVLSGTGSDGSHGIRDIHAAGGIVLVQTPDTAKFDGMPRSAIDTGVVDEILAPHDMAAALLNFAAHVAKGGKGTAKTALVSEDGLTSIFTLLREEYGIDFSHYKPNTVGRRIERRLELNRIDDLDRYATRLRGDPAELNSLYRDLLIGVTRFFRDKEAFEMLEKEVIPDLLQRVPADEELRVWVAACATGEEAYSLAIVLHEALLARKRPPAMKIFATDVHRTSLEIASAGVYSGEALADVSAPRLQRYFLHRGESFQVTPELRKLVVFAPHNLIRDAPFTKLDLVTCRNLLIYFRPATQKKVLTLFHFSLKPGSVLFLGPSESPGELADEFETLNPDWKIYRKRRDIRLLPDVRLPLPTGYSNLRATGVPHVPANTLPDNNLLRAYDALLERYVPPSLLVNANYELIHSFAGASHYLTVRDGRPSASILDNVDRNLRLALSGALQRAAKAQAAIMYSGVSIKTGDRDESVNLRVQPLGIREMNLTYFLVTLEKSEGQASVRGLDVADGDGRASDQMDLHQESHDRIRILEEEVRYTKENLQATVEEMETTNEELQATNEELVASNEELQSTNEELHSVNEELYTVNAEYQRKITELTVLTDDMDNLLHSTDVAIIFLDRDLTIRKFTARISALFHILPQDLGRPLESFSHTLLYEGLLDDVRSVVATGKSAEKDIQDRHGNWILSRILPYRARGDVAGAVLTFIDISKRKQTEEQLRRLSKVFMDAADPIIIEDLDRRIVDVNTETERACGWMRGELIGKNVNVLMAPDFRKNRDKLRRRCIKAEHVRNVESAFVTKSGQVHPVLLTFSLLTAEDGTALGIATIAKDITALKRAEQAATEEVKRRDHFLAMLSHELRNPLSAILNSVGLLERVKSDEALTNAMHVIRRQSEQMASLLDDLLDVARITHGKIHFHVEPLDLRLLVDDAVQAVHSQIEARGHQLSVSVPDRPLPVEGDRTRLLQIIENLLTNSTKYTPQGGRIELLMEHDSGWAVIRVRDNGVGIPKDMLETIFGVFVQSNQDLDRHSGGLGVGLTLVRSLVEMHRGTVQARSDGIGFGSEFIVRIPISSKPPIVVADPPATTKVVRDFNVVLVEDRDDSREILKVLLEYEGYRVAAAADGRKGLDLILSTVPRVALVDIGLPEIDGYELARRVRKTLGPDRVCLVALTGYGQEKDRKAVFDAGFNEHLVKPVGLADLTRVLDAIDRCPDPSGSLSTDAT